MSLVAFIFQLLSYYQVVKKTCNIQQNTALSKHVTVTAFKSDLLNTSGSVYLFLTLFKMMYRKNNEK